MDIDDDPENQMEFFQAQNQKVDGNNKSKSYLDIQNQSALDDSEDHIIKNESIVDH